MYQSYPEGLLEDGLLEPTPRISDSVQQIGEFAYLTTSQMTLMLQSPRSHLRNIVLGKVSLPAEDLEKIPLILILLY